MKNFTLLILLSILCYSSSFAQVSFGDSTHLLSNTDFTSGVATAVVDMNGDGKDDIVRLNDARSLEIE